MEDQLKPEDLPRLGQRVALRLLTLWGWRLLYRPLPGPHGICVIYPHTSNWDFVIGMVGKWAIGLHFRWLAKDSLFKIPLVGRWFHAMGGDPVDRSAPTGMIQRQAARMHAAPWYWLGITPEGTRGYRPYWKSGFYHLALEAKVPLCLVYLDYPNKILAVRDHIFLTGDQETDLAAIRAGFHGHEGLHPEDAAPIVFNDKKRD